MAIGPEPFTSVMERVDVVVLARVEQVLYNAGPQQHHEPEPQSYLPYPDPPLQDSPRLDQPDQIVTLAVEQVLHGDLEESLITAVKIGDSYWLAPVWLAPGAPGEEDIFFLRREDSGRWRIDTIRYGGARDDLVSALDDFRNGVDPIARHFQQAAGNESPYGAAPPMQDWGPAPGSEAYEALGDTQPAIHLTKFGVYVSPE